MKCQAQLRKWRLHPLHHKMPTFMWKSIAVYIAGGDLRQESQQHSSEKKPEIQVQMLKLDKISGILCEIAFVGIIVHRETEKKNKKQS